MVSNLLQTNSKTESCTTAAVFRKRISATALLLSNPQRMARRCGARKSGLCDGFTFQTELRSLEADKSPACGTGRAGWGGDPGGPSAHAT